MRAWILRSCRSPHTPPSKYILSCSMWQGSLDILDVKKMDSFSRSVCHHILRSWIICIGFTLCSRDRGSFRPQGSNAVFIGSELTTRIQSWDCSFSTMTVRLSNMFWNRLCHGQEWFWRMNGLSSYSSSCLESIWMCCTDLEDPPQQWPLLQPLPVQMPRLTTLERASYLCHFPRWAYLACCKLIPTPWIWVHCSLRFKNVMLSTSYRRLITELSTYFFRSSNILNWNLVHEPSDVPSEEKCRRIILDQTLRGRHDKLERDWWFQHSKLPVSSLPGSIEDYVDFKRPELKLQSFVVWYFVVAFMTEELLGRNLSTVSLSGSTYEYVQIHPHIYIPPLQR